jgi:hypothetical protein
MPREAAARSWGRRQRRRRAHKRRTSEVAHEADRGATVGAQALEALVITQPSGTPKRSAVSMPADMNCIHRTRLPGARHEAATASV